MVAKRILDETAVLEVGAKLFVVHAHAETDAASLLVVARDWQNLPVDVSYQLLVAPDVNGDGAVDFVTDSVGIDVWQALGSIDGGEVESLP